MKHLVSLIGLATNGAGGILLLLCPPPKPPRELTPDGIEKHPQTFIHKLPRPGGSPRGRLRYLWRSWGFKAGAFLLVVGFFVQIAAELMN